MKNRQKIRKGILTVFLLFFPATYYYLSPYLIIPATLEGIISGSFLLFVLLFLSSFIVGRAFCGWACPAGGIQDIVMNVNNKKINKGNIIKWIIWLPWIVTIIVLAVKNGGYHTIDPFYRTTHGLSIDNVYALIVYLLVLILIILPAFIIGKRSFCHHICWMAPFMISGRKLSNLLKLPALKLSSISTKCIHCHSCTEHCPMSLPVEDMVNKQKMENLKCILCATCVDGCQSKAINYRFKRIVSKKQK